MFGLFKSSGRSSSSSSSRRAGEEAASAELLFTDTHQAFRFPHATDKKRRSAIFRAAEFNGYGRYCVVPKDTLEETVIGELDRREDRAIGCVLGMVVGDALGAPLEFSPVVYGKTFVKGLNDEAEWKKPIRNRFQLKPGQWTDDASMGLCLIDSLLLHPEFNPLDLRLRFLNWWELGYNNAFGFDKPRPSCGLGGSIGMSFREFTASDELPMEERKFTRAGDRSTSGNGSIMRMAGVPVRFAKGESESESGSDAAAVDMETALLVAYQQSKTTHQGDEAAHCVQLMTYLILLSINHPSQDPAEVKADIYGDKISSFECDRYSVMCLARSECEEEHEDNKHLDLEDRKWDWKRKDYRFAPGRAEQMPGYIGSYAMDGLAMALHCVWHARSFSEAVVKAANLCGDADTVASITGQLAGALYGRSSIPAPWLKRVWKWDPHHTIEKRAYLLYHNSFLPPEAYGDDPITIHAHSDGEAQRKVAKSADSHSSTTLEDDDGDATEDLTASDDSGSDSDSNGDGRDDRDATDNHGDRSP